LFYRCFIERYSWYEAEEYCRNLNLNNYSNWRLPTRKELNKLSSLMYGDFDLNWVNWFTKNQNLLLKNIEGKGSSIHKDFIKNIPKKNSFWTSESIGLENAWFVSFSAGNNNQEVKSSHNCVLCVKNK